METLAQHLDTNNEIAPRCKQQKGSACCDAQYTIKKKDTAQFAATCVNRKHTRRASTVIKYCHSLWDRENITIIDSTNIINSSVHLSFQMAQFYLGTVFEWIWLWSDLLQCRQCNRCEGRSCLLGLWFVVDSATVLFQYSCKWNVVSESWGNFSDSSRRVWMTFCQQPQSHYADSRAHRSGVKGEWFSHPQLR